VSHGKFQASRPIAQDRRDLITDARLEVLDDGGDFMSSDTSTSIQSRRLNSCDRALARHLFTMMAEVFEHAVQPLSDEYLDRLLARDEFWVFAAQAGDKLLGGLTAHVLPMTYSESLEVFVYDVAVQRAYQRQGVGRHLISAVRELAARRDIPLVFVAADNADTNALDFYRALGATDSSMTLFTFERAER
jgi:aminoglycoside 3-N-acetyltransferase I